MFRTYTISEVERICGISRRTISEYVAKGLLSGPSHRGRGARYPQADVDALKLLPRFRTLMKREFPNLKVLAAFLRQLSIRDLHQLAAKKNESSFVLEVRRLRVRNNLAALAPHVAPEQIEAILAKLTPGQILAIDSGRYQIGAVVDIAALLQDAADSEVAVTEQATVKDTAVNDPAVNDHSGEQPESSVSVSWLGNGGGQVNGSNVKPDDIGSLNEVVTRLETRAAAKRQFEETQPDLRAVMGNGNGSNPVQDTAKEEVRDESVGQRLNDISERLERLEAMLAHE